MRFLPMGRAALLVELDGLDAAMSLYAAIETRRAAAETETVPAGTVPAGDLVDGGADDPFAGVTEVVPAARTVLVRFDPLFTDRDELAETLRGLDVNGHVEHRAKTVTVPVAYDGEDLDAVADLLGLSSQEIVARHSGHAWTAAFGGFAPGFTYLTGGDPIFDVPRRKNPRLAVPAGAVGLAGTFSGVYPRPSSGGWQLIGTTDVPMWDDRRNPPALIQPGDTVRFEPVRAQVTANGSVDTVCDDTVAADASQCETSRETHDAGAESVRDHGRLAVAVTDSNHAGNDASESAVPAADLTIDDPGMFAAFEDDGRRAATMGVTGSGAADPGTFHLANALVGNPAGTPAIETAGGGLRLTAHRTLVLAVTGAPADVTVDGTHGITHIARQEAFLMQPGERLELSFPEQGFRNYIAVQGGFDAPRVLGSASADTLSGLGPAALKPNTPLAVVATATNVPQAPSDGTLPLDKQQSCLQAMCEPTGEPTSCGRSPSKVAGRAVGGADWGREQPACLGAVSSPVPTVGQPQPWPSDLPATGTTTTLDVTLGPRDDWFTAQGITDFLDQEWTVTPQSNRVGLRLHGGRALERRDARELASEGMIPGAIEIPSNGQPVLFLRDQPVTGGYPVIAVLTKSALALAGQLPPGARVRFHINNHGKESSC
ncbi:biotin carboxyl carrier protein [Bifidobacterium biavatii DSM 23969]|uniref:Biotin carboxyl carrier protein n=2 Tax=Bifidobacterium biavatii TaxID=762212 RepID=A0A087A0Z6_9BIFI|nr:biotin carboxyl carrier protein [Bifidobacterium biavatii DSM 23969]